MFRPSEDSGVVSEAVLSHMNGRPLILFVTNQTVALRSADQSEAVHETASILCSATLELFSNAQRSSVESFVFIEEIFVLYYNGN